MSKIGKLWRIVAEKHRKLLSTFRAGLGQNPPSSHKEEKVQGHTCLNQHLHVSYCSKKHWPICNPTLTITRLQHLASTIIVLWWGIKAADREIHVVLSNHNLFQFEEHRQLAQPKKWLPVVLENVEHCGVSLSKVIQEYYVTDVLMSDVKILCSVQVDGPLTL